jgi:hypothetical protein
LIKKCNVFMIMMNSDTRTMIRTKLNMGRLDA